MQTRKKSFSFEMAPGEPEEKLAFTADILEQFAEMAQDTHARMEAAPRGSEDSKSSFQVLFNTLPKDPKTLAGNPTKPNSVLFGLRAKLSDDLSFGVRERGSKEQEDGIFWTPLHQEVVEIDDFAADSPAMSRPKAILFVDTTPGVDGGTAFVHPLVPLEPKLEEAQMIASPTSTKANDEQVRPQVKSKLEAVGEADFVVRDQPLGSNSNNEFFYKFYKGKEPTAVLRMGPGEQSDPYKAVVPGITDLESVGTVSFARLADQEYAEHIPLNGEERKALLATLGQAYNKIPQPQGKIEDEGLQRQYRFKQTLGMATNVLGAMVSDGNLGFYENLVSDLDLSGSWLARLKAGESPRDVF